MNSPDRTCSKSLCCTPAMTCCMSALYSGSWLSAITKTSFGSTGGDEDEEGADESSLEVSCLLRQAAYKGRSPSACSRSLSHMQLREP